MCGLTGFWSPHARPPRDAEERVRGMALVLRHRGPDDGGAWTEDDGTVGLGHRRLSILELSAQGSQPMASESGRYVIVFNGEIYNHLELRSQLEHRARWRGGSDTETLLAAFEAWGIRGATQRLRGMFAFAVWDRRERKLALGRDRVGIKPLYYAWSVGGDFLFGSELKPLRRYPGFAAEIDRRALGLYVRHGYVPTPLTIYKDARKLPPGSILTIGSPVRNAVAIERYWRAEEVVERGLAEPLNSTDDRAIDELERVLADAVRSHMLSDVPLGAFLSGGIDSSTVVSLMQAQSSRPVRTFSIGFEDPRFNEATHARAVARYLGTEHEELYVSPVDALNAIPEIPFFYDEPFADVSQIPTLLVSRLARKHVKVVLTGDGGDELFAGYNRHFWVPALWRRLRRIPGPMRSAMSRALTLASPRTWDALWTVADPLLPARLKQRGPGYKLHKMARILEARDAESMFEGLVSHHSGADAIVLGRPAEVPVEPWYGSPRLDGPTSRMMFRDLVGYLSDDILAKVDRATMSVGLEGRVPLLDHRVVEFAWRLPLRMKVRGGAGKWILRQVLARRVPLRLVDRPKAGFGVPIDLWLRGPLRDWAESLLDGGRIAREGLLDADLVRKLWAEQLSGASAWEHQIWVLLMFESWLASTRNDAPLA
ncbi:MAG TPA: asparagine synthase (glutamine-hydrolyzing) [Planctomycetota bacterium]|nr:asparagine synthase (glutamine-hydrolyzing) [Planctomycetota bacterium]